MGIEEYVVPGKILYLSVCFPHEEEYHNKYFVVVGISNNPFLLKINSRKVKEHEFCLRQSFIHSSNTIPILIVVQFGMD